MDDSEVVNNVEKEILGIFMPKLISNNCCLDKKKYKKRKINNTVNSSKISVKRDDIYETIINNRVLFDQILSVEDNVINQCMDLFKQYFFKESYSLLSKVPPDYYNGFINNGTNCGLEVNSVIKSENQFELMLKELLTGTLFFNNLVAINKHFSFNTQLTSNDLRDYFYSSSEKNDDLIGKVMLKFYEELKNLLIGNTTKSCTY